MTRPGRLYQCAAQGWACCCPHSEADVLQMLLHAWDVEVFELMKRHGEQNVSSLGALLDC